MTPDQHLLRWIAATAACGFVLTATAPGGFGPRGHVRAPADTVVRMVVRDVAAPPGRLVEELAIGGVDATGPAGFAFLAGAVAGPDGSIYIADAGTPIVKKFDRNGKYIRSFGGRGDGPGEYGAGIAQMNGQNRGAEGVALLSDGRVVVHSRVGTRLLMYSPQGTPTLTMAVNRLGQGWDQRERQPPMLLAATGDVIWARMRILDSTFKRTPSYWTNPPQYLRLDGSGRIIDTLVAPAPPREHALLTHGDRKAPWVRHHVPFTSTFLWTVSSGGYFVTAWPDEGANTYAVDLRLPSRAAAAGSPPGRWRPSDPIVSLRVPYTPVPVHPNEGADFTAAYTAVYRTYDKGWRWNGPAIPQRKPAFKSLWVDETGRIWIHRYNRGLEDRSVAKNQLNDINEPRLGWARERWPEPSLYDVIEPGGKFVGQVETLDQIYPQAARGDTLWAIVDGEDGPLTVKRYRIHWKR